MVNHKVLVVEDDPVQQRLLRHYLQDRFQVTVAGSFMDGLSAAMRQRFDILLLDIRLGSYSGVDLLSRLRQTELYRDTPAVAITAFKELALRVSFLEQGFDGYLLKPFSQLELLNTLDAFEYPQRQEHPKLTLWRELVTAWHAQQKTMGYVRKTPVMPLASEASGSSTVYSSAA